MFNMNDAMYAAAVLGVSFDKYTPLEFLEGINIESEHGTVHPQTNVTNNDLITTVKDKDGKIVSMQANIAVMNKIVSQIALKIQDKIDNQDSRDISIRLGTFTGITLLAGRGPKVPIRISSIGNLDTKISSEFTSAGINQSIHRILANINCQIDVLTPFNTISSQIEEKVILAENVIIGEIPENYLDIGNLLNANKNN